MVHVKICGITSLEDLRGAVEAGADAVGFVVGFPPSPRNLPIDLARRLAEAAAGQVRRVAVTIPKSVRDLEAVCEGLDVEAVQVHGLRSQRGEVRRLLPGVRLIGAVQATASAVEEALEVSEVFDVVLLDSYAPDGRGGTGRRYSWELGRRVREAIGSRPLVLAGGLTSENVKEAVLEVRPHGVDVSSGVEARPGVKSRERMFEFVRNAREAEAG